MRFGKLRNKGAAIILVAGITLGFLLLFAVLAIDFSRMYYVRGELQNAADAAALAGADQLTGVTDSSTADFEQGAARQEAWKFACKNRAAHEPVYLATNSSTDCDAPPSFAQLNSTTNSDTGDIIVGNWRTDTTGVTCATGWEPFGSGSFCRANGSTGLSINAVRIMARRTTASPGGTVPFLFPRIIPGLSSMGVVRQAIATRKPKAQAPIAICIDTCNPGVVLPTGTLLYWAPYATEVLPGNIGIAWTSFNPSSQLMEQDVINSFFCGAEKDACGLTVYTNNGYANALARQFRCAFKNPLYFSSDKTCSDGSCDSSTDNVTSWTVLVPIFSSPDGCPPGDQPQPDTIVQYGHMRIIEVYASGGGGTNECACGAYDAPALNGPNAILVDQIVCEPCSTTGFLGSKAQLVK